MRGRLNAILATGLSAMVQAPASVGAMPASAWEFAGAEQRLSVVEVSCKQGTPDGHAFSCAGRHRHAQQHGYWYLGYSVNCYWYPDRPDCDWRYGWHWYPGYSPYSAWLADPRR
jgi:hypothetical protein